MVNARVLHYTICNENVWAGITFDIVIYKLFEMFTLFSVRVLIWTSEEIAAVSELRLQAKQLQ